MAHHEKSTMALALMPARIKLSGGKSYMDLMFTKRWVVPLSEVTPGYALKPFHLLNMMQDAADDAVEALNPPADYWTNGCGWMLLQYSIRLERPLAAGDAVTINTGHRPLHDLYSSRRFRFLDDTGRQFGLADSKWCYVNLARRRPLRLSRALPRVFLDLAEDAASFEPGYFDPPPLERVDLSTRLRVRMGELDVNGHVNNAYYLSWAAEAVPQDVYLTCGICEADIVYKHEALSGMELLVETQRDDLTFLHRITCGDTLIAAFRVKWAKIPERRA